MQFCGAETRIPLGAVDLALRTGADLIPAWAWRIDGFRFHARIGPPLEVVRTGDFDKDVRLNAERLLLKTVVGIEDICFVFSVVRHQVVLYGQR